MSTQPNNFLQPTNIDGELNDDALQDFLQSIVVGITGMPGELVLPRWQTDDEPNMPLPPANWAAIGVQRRTRDNFEFEGHVPSTVSPDTPGNNFVIRHQLLNILVSFYGPNNEANCERLAMGLGLAQNRWVFTQNGYGLVEVGESTAVPALVNNQWLHGTDFPFVVRRRQKYTYSVAEITAAEVIIYIDNPVKQYVVNITKNSPH